jgi:uncharacterized protein with PIN domain
MKFLADHMLGKLARWLRFLGYDTLYPEVMEDNELIEIAEREGRIILTRDRVLSSRIEGALLVISDNLDVQLKQVFVDMGLKTQGMMSRCSVCNSEIETVTKKDAAGKVPDNVFKLHDEFWHCPQCNRYYWKGSHYKKILDRLENVD